MKNKAHPVGAGERRQRAKLANSNDTSENLRFSERSYCYRRGRVIVSDPDDDERNCCLTTLSATEIAHAVHFYARRGGINNGCEF